MPNPTTRATKMQPCRQVRRAPRHFGLSASGFSGSVAARSAAPRARGISGFADKQEHREGGLPHKGKKTMSNGIRKAARITIIGLMAGIAPVASAIGQDMSSAQPNASQ